MIAAKRLVGSVIDAVYPVGFWLESMTGTSTLCSDECNSPWHISSVSKCGNGRLCCEYVIEVYFNRCIGSDGCVAGVFSEMIVSELGY